MAAGIKFGPEIHHEVLRLVADRVPYTEIQRRTGISSGLTSKWATDAGIARGTTRTYELDESFFDVLDSEAKWWLLGLIATDGYIRKNGKSFCLTLQASDRDILVRIKNELKHEAPIFDFRQRQRSGRTFSYSRLTVSSQRLVSRLLVLGYHHAKSHTFRPLTPPQEFAAAWWRGCVDGDGQVKRLSRKNSAFVRLSGNRMMTCDFADYCKSIGCSVVIYPDRSIFLACVQKLNHVQKIVRELYGTATIYLERKKQVADTILAMTPTRNYAFETCEGIA